MPTLTANQHYVWQHYLQPWCIARKLWCKRADRSEPFATSPRNIGSKRFFYEIKDLSKDDLDYLEMLISQSTAHELRETNRGWLRLFQLTFILRKQLENGEFDSEKRGRIESELRTVEKTIGESLHGSTEARAVPILQELRHAQSAFYEDSNSGIDFINFLCHQYFRTAKMRNIVNSIQNPLSHSAERTWPVEAFIYATNLAFSFVCQRDKYRVIFLRNVSNIPIITGDQPVINLHNAKIKDVELYYPLKPDLDMVFTSNIEKYSKNCIDISSIAVESYNHRIYARSDSQIYGNDPSYLTSLASLPKDGLL